MAEATTTSINGRFQPFRHGEFWGVRDTQTGIAVTGLNRQTAIDIAVRKNHGEQGVVAELEVVTEAQLDAMVSKAVEAADADIGEALRKAITAQVGEGWTGDVDPPSAFQWDEALRRLVRCLMLNAFDYGDDGELIRR